MNRSPSRVDPWRSHRETSAFAAASRWRRNAAGPAIVVFICLAATAWVRPLLLPDEGRYAAVAWEMLRSGDWLTPTFNGLPFFDKPPLAYWITAASLSVFGMNEWAARMAPMLGAWLGALAIYVFLLRWVNRRSARLTLVALLAQPLFFAGAQYANLDMLVAGFIAAAVLLAAHAALEAEHDRPYRRLLALAYAAAGFGILAKGLIGFVLPALVLFAWLATRRQWRLVRRLMWLPGMGLTLVVATPWFIAMQLRHPRFLDAIFVEQHFTRFLKVGFNNPQPFWFFPAVLLVASLPWLPWIFKVVRPASFRKAEDDPVRLLMVLWVVVVTLFFSLPRSKLVGYMFPTLMPLAWLAAEGFRSVGVPTAASRRLWWLSAAIGIGLGLTALAVYTVGPVRTSRPLALALAAAHEPGQPVVMLDRYDYDVPFYARLAEPMRVVTNWSDPALYQRDDWRRELAEAGRFATATSAAVLLEPTALAATLCASPIAWVIGDSSAGARYPFLNSALPVFAHRGATLWKVESERAETAKALDCGSHSVARRMDETTMHARPP